MRLFARLATLTLCISLATAYEVPRHENNNACTFGKPTRNENGRIVCDECADLPPFVKKHGVIGTQADLPEGYVTWVADGVWVSPTRAAVPHQIPGTEQATDVRIAPDGKWLLVRGRSDQPLRILSLDGAVSVAVPNPPQKDKRFNFGWVRNGPYGDEVFWGDYKMNLTVTAIRVDLSGSQPRFGDTRVLSEGIEWDQNWNQSIWISGDHMFGTWRHKIHPRDAVHVLHVTIPDSGRGTAGLDDAWRYGQEKLSYFECGPAMSWSGALVAYNPAGREGSFHGVEWKRAIPGCGKHSGPVVVPFQTQATAVERAGIGDFLFATPGVSINWAPYPYYNHVHDFHIWNFTNDDDYLVCRLKEERHHKAKPDELPEGPTVNGVWILHHPSNTWTPVVDPDVIASAEACYFGSLDTIGYPRAWREGTKQVTVPR